MRFTRPDSVIHDRFRHHDDGAVESCLQQARQDANNGFDCAVIPGDGRTRSAAAPVPKDGAFPAVGRSAQLDESVVCPVFGMSTEVSSVNVPGAH